MDTQATPQTQNGKSGKGNIWRIILVIILALAAIGILWQVFRPKGSVIAPAAEELPGYGQKCTSVFHVYYYDAGGNKIDVATLEKAITVDFTYDDTYELEDGTISHGFDVNYVNDPSDALTENEYNEFRSRIVAFKMHVENNMAHAGYGMLGISVEMPEWLEVDNYFSAVPSNQLDNSDFGYWSTSRKPIDPNVFCSSEYTDFWIEVERHAHDDWYFNRGKMVFSDEVSFIEFEAPDVSDFVGTEYMYNSSPELDLYHGEPIEVEHPVGSFKLNVESKAFTEIRNAMTELPFTAVYDTDDYGNAYGVFEK